MTVRNYSSAAEVFNRRVNVATALSRGMTPAAAAANLRVAVHLVNADYQLLRRDPVLCRKVCQFAGIDWDPGPPLPLIQKRRFEEPIVPTGEPALRLNADDPAVVNETTKFPSRIFKPKDRDRVLISGENNRKIGNVVVQGRLKGAPIYTLTLVERRDCPPCPLSRECYMNASPNAVRFEGGEELETAIAHEVPILAKSYPGGFLVRLHVGGDFYSWDYLKVWAGLLREHKPLNVFGFTHHGPDSEIGADIAELRAHFSPRFEVRHSSVMGPHGSVVVEAKITQKRVGDGVVCPEQRDAVIGSEKPRCCGSCGVCWTGHPTPIVFMMH